MLKCRSDQDRQPAAQGGVSGLFFAGAMLVVIGAFAANFSQTMRNRERRKDQAKKIELLEQRVGEQSVGAVADEVLARSKRVEVRMESWADDRRRLATEVAELAAWKATQQRAQGELAAQIKAVREKQLSGKELEQALAALETRLVAARDRSVNLVKEAVVELKGEVKQQGEADQAAARALQGLVRRLASLDALLDKLRATQDKDRQAAGTQGAQLTVQFGNLGAELAGLKKDLAQQAARAAALEKAVEALKKHEHQKEQPK